jgi:uncharacterized Zn finger protein (UPF0148 family)
VIGPAEAALREERARDEASQRMATLEQVVRAAVADALDRVLARLLTCPQCGHPFFKTGKMVYCSTRCGQQARWARFAATRPARDYRAERAGATVGRT